MRLYDMNELLYGTNQVLETSRMGIYLGVFQGPARMWNFYYIEVDLPASPARMRVARNMGEDRVTD